jgi:hypothetical protein
MRQGVRFGLAALVTVAFAGMTVFGAADDKPKYDIETIMDKAHGEKNDKLLKKVLTDKASDAEKKELLELYVELGKNKPDKGSKESWKKKTDALAAVQLQILPRRSQVGLRRPGFAVLATPRRLPVGRLRFRSVDAGAAAG